MPELSIAFARPLCALIQHTGITKYFSVYVYQAHVPFLARLPLCQMHIQRPLADPLNQPVSRASVQIKITSHRAASNMIIMSADDLVNSNLHQFVRAVNPKGREAWSHSISARGTRALWRVLEQDGNGHGKGMGREGWLAVLRPPNTARGFLNSGPPPS